jgi:hypothetical protein
MRKVSGCGGDDDGGGDDDDYQWCHHDVYYHDYVCIHVYC